MAFTPLPIWSLIVAIAKPLLHVFYIQYYAASSLVYSPSCCRVQLVLDLQRFLPANASMIQ